MKRPPRQALRHSRLVGLIILAACTNDNPVAPSSSAIAIPTGALSTWVSSQPCQIGFSNPFNDDDSFGTPLPTASYACGVRWQMTFPPNGEAVPGIWWFPDDPPTQTPYTHFSIGPRYAAWQTGPIEITFTPAVSRFNLVLSKEESGLSWETAVLSSGHYMVAFDSTGQEIGRVHFDSGGVVSEKALSVRGIRKVLVYPVIVHSEPGQWPIAEAVGHRVSFSPDCPPVADPIIDSDDFRSRYDSLMRASRQTMEHMFGREWGMRGWINPNTMKVEIDWPTYTDNNPCHVTIGASTGDPRIPLTRIHSHVFVTGSDETIVCGVFGPYVPQANGGSLNESGDWDNSAGQGDYIFGPEWIFKLRPNTPLTDRPKNPFRWKKGANGCFSLQPVP